MDPRHNDLADRITEDALQLLFTARQDIAEGPSDPILQRAQFRVLDAIEVLRDVAQDLRGDDQHDSPTRLLGADAEFAQRRCDHVARRARWQQDRERWLEGRTRRREGN